nr:ribosomal protein L36 [Drynaria acuminata]QOY24959.1 ribosomal protein L36 [Drynaria acuminata]
MVICCNPKHKQRQG